MSSKASQETPDCSAAAFWVNHVGTGVWRTARIAHLCDDRDWDCVGIRSGDRYLDTGERVSVRRTYKLCETHATEHDAEGPWPKQPPTVVRAA